jgi:hypothetical protein
MLTLGLGLSGCWNPFSPGNGGDGDGPGKDRKTLNHLLEFFATVYEDKDLVSYTESLDDFYTFEFDPKDYSDAGVSEEIPYWGRGEDIDRTRLMFTSAKTQAILMDLSRKDMEWIPDVFDVGGNIVEGWTCRINPWIDVTIEEKPGDEPITKQVRDSRLTVSAIPDKNYPGLWTILKITETVMK